MKNLKQQIESQFKTIALLIVLLCAFAPLAAQNEPVKLGFIPLTDCSPLVMAKELGLFKKYGVDVVLTKEAS